MKVKEVSELAGETIFKCGRGFFVSVLEVQN